MIDASGHVAKQKILALSTSYPLRESSVSGIFVHNLYRAMSDTWSIEVLCPDEQIQSGGNFDGVKVTPIRYALKKLQVLGGSGGLLPSMKANPLKLLLLPFMLSSLFFYTLLKARTANIIHANWAICGVIAGLAGKLFDRKVVLTLRGSDVEKSRSSLAFEWQLQLALAGADSVVCVSKAMMNDLLSVYPKYAKKISYCHNGISDEFFNSTSKKRNSDAPLQILAVGSLIPVKGFDLLLEALHLLPSAASLYVTIIGEGPERADLQIRIKDYGLESKVVLKGAVEYFAMPGIMAESDLFVLSSRTEGRPNVVAEAVASGLPIISADLPGVQGMVVDGKNGWVFKPGDPIALSKAIQHAISNKNLLCAIGESGRQMIRKDSSWSVAADYYGALFNKLLGSGIK